MEKRYPFKYLDSYNHSDKDFYFGRGDEISSLYEMTFQSDLLLVYGASGTGKTSLILCGLSNKFETYDWLPLYIRRNHNINESLAKTIKENIHSTGESDSAFDALYKSDSCYEDFPLAADINRLWINNFKPIYLIFDQFEELYIMGDKKEQEHFYDTIKKILSLDRPVKIVISIREEYLGYLYEFEKEIPTLLKKKLRVEAMSIEKIKTILYGINSNPQSLVSLEKGKEDELIDRIYDKLRINTSIISIDLPYLQVLLDKFYISITNDDTYKSQAILTIEEFDKLGDIGNILRELLDGLVLKVERDFGLDKKEIWSLLSNFVTLEGTKKALNEQVIYLENSTVDSQTIFDILQFFVNKRILRYVEEERIYEIVHDALAKQIHENRTDDELAILQTKKLIKNTTSLKEDTRNFYTEKQLNIIDQYIEKITVTDEEKEWIDKSREDVKEQIKKIGEDLKRKKDQLKKLEFFLELQVYFSFWLLVSF